MVDASRSCRITPVTGIFGDEWAGFSYFAGDEARQKFGSYGIWRLYDGLTPTDIKVIPGLC